MRLISVTFLLCLTMAAKAVVGDAFKGIWPVTDKSVMKSLNGTWNLKVIEGFVGTDKTVPAEDNTWSPIPVPGNWEAYGRCKPTYSFPDSVTGYYRTEFTVPQEWKGQQVCIRLDGVLRGYDLWLNGKLVGSWELPYNTCQFDLTPYLTKDVFKGGKQQLAMRVYSHYAGYQWDCFDDWAPMGIFRDVTLFTVPKTHLSDLTVQTKTDGTVTVKAEVANKTKNTAIECTIEDARHNIVIQNSKFKIQKSSPAAANSSLFTLHSSLKNPHLWTPETPYLYTLRVDVKEKGKTLQTFTQKIGLREIKIVRDSVLTINGQPVKFRGVTTHATDPKTVKVISDELTLKDMKLMKEASINYIRTSHYPREPRFFELCDSLGFYVVCEVPFGSRGEKLLELPEMQDNLRTRTLATITCHKNYPSVVIWSLGNENPFPKSCRELGKYAKSLDSTRYICYPQKAGMFKKINYQTFPKIAEILAPHYPNVSYLEGRFSPSNRPVIFTEYCHTLGISFEDHHKMWDIIERHENLAGGSVWEWVDQGMPFVNEELRMKNEELKVRGEEYKHYGFEEKVYTTPYSGFEMNGNKGTDGLLYADRTPLPNYYELQHNYAQAFVSEELKVKSEKSPAADNSSLFTLHFSLNNRFDFINLKDNVTFHWILTEDRDTIAQGAFSPDCAPHSTVPYTLSLPTLNPNSLAILNVETRNQKGWTLLRQAFKIQDSKIKITSALSARKQFKIQKSSPAVDNSSLFTLHSSLNPMVRVGRKITLAEVMLQKKHRIERYLQPLDNPYVKGEVKQEGNTVNYTLTSCDKNNHFLSELGVAYLLPKQIDRVQWIGQGPFASYPGRYNANRYGFWALQQDDIYFEGNRMGVDVCWLSDKDGNGVLIAAPEDSLGNVQPLNINFEQTDKGIVVTVNAAVSGQGPKFNTTPYEVKSRSFQSMTGSFQLCETKAGDAVPHLFKAPATVPAAFRPFYTQYDTYQNKLEDITPEEN